jgi:acyl-coenzyme A thioesterase PaaI-like protein
LRKGHRVCHVGIRCTQDGRLVAEGRGVYNIHRRPKTA